MDTNTRTTALIVDALTKPTLESHERPRTRSRKRTPQGYPYYCNAVSCVAIISSFISCIVIFRLQFKTSKPVNGRASLVLKVAASKGHSQQRSIPVSRVSVYGTVSTLLPQCSTLKQSSRTNVLKIRAFSCTVHTQSR